MLLAEVEDESVRRGSKDVRYGVDVVSPELSHVVRDGFGEHGCVPSAANTLQSWTGWERKGDQAADLWQKRRTVGSRGGFRGLRHAYCNRDFRSVTKLGLRDLKHGRFFL